jgi:hypothetical protein
MQAPGIVPPIAAAPLKELRVLLASGEKLSVGLPEVDRLRAEIRRREWMDLARRVVGTKVTTKKVSARERERHGYIERRERSGTRGGAAHTSKGLRLRWDACGRRGSLAQGRPKLQYDGVQVAAPAYLRAAYAMGSSCGMLVMHGPYILSKS